MKPLNSTRCEAAERDEKNCILMQGREKNKKAQAFAWNNLRRFLSEQIKYSLGQQSIAVWQTEGREGYQEVG